ncbi:MAG: hypothetical protein IKS32_05970 [Solobacterium sp.]|nr:hypothetical protein [Solobacterium sp.]
MTCHDGFTLYDLVCYNTKHNEENGEDNRDGTNDNDSWNCGAEGETDDPQINALRSRQMRNFLTLLVLSRGVPMLMAGDEFANSQSGNNNAYCQDKEISWLNWENLRTYEDLFRYVKHLLAFRKAHPILRASDYQFEHNDTEYPELSFHSTEPWQLDEQAPNLTVAILYAEGREKYGVKRDCFIYAMFNAYWEPHCFTLPVIPAGMKWRFAFHAEKGSCAPGKETEWKESERIVLGPRSSAVLIAR